MSAVLASGPLMHGEVPLGEAIAFWILAPISVLGAIGMVAAKNAVHSALSLVATMMSLGFFYVIEQGPFIGLVQIIVYTGAIMILFLFVLMLIGRDSQDSLIESLRGQRAAALAAGLGFALLLTIPLAKAFSGVKAVNLAQQNQITTKDITYADGSEISPHSNVHELARQIFTHYLFAFELTSALLIVAAVGAMVLAHTERDEPRPTQKRIARERLRGLSPQTATGPGVLSSGNAVGTPALLPDGSASPKSILTVQGVVPELPRGGVQ